MPEEIKQWKDRPLSTIIALACILIVYDGSNRLFDYLEKSTDAALVAAEQMREMNVKLTQIAEDTRVIRERNERRLSGLLDNKITAK